LAARDEDGTGALLGPLASLTRVDACNPLLQAHPTWARDELEGRGISTSLTPVSGHLALPPSRSPTRSTHLGWGTRHTHSSAQGPPGLETPTSGLDHFLRDHQQKGDIAVFHVSTENQLADIFTKPLDEKTFCRLRSELNVLDSRNLD
jgi:hypothetical protein